MATYAIRAKKLPYFPRGSVISGHCKLQDRVRVTGAPTPPVEREPRYPIFHFFRLSRMPSDDINTGVIVGWNVLL
jgi:hypothetical protein